MKAVLYLINYRYWYIFESNRFLPIGHQIYINHLQIKCSLEYKNSLYTELCLHHYCIFIEYIVTQCNNNYILDEIEKILTTINTAGAGVILSTWIIDNISGICPSTAPA